MKDKIRQIIWKAVQSHFSLNDQTRLETNLKYEKNKTIAQVVAIGLCDQYGIDRKDVESILCIEPIGYDNKLKTFTSSVAKLAIKEPWKDDDLIDFDRRLSMCSRFIRRRTNPHYKV